MGQLGPPGGREASRGRPRPKVYDPPMAAGELDWPDAPACPLLGLAGDPRTHFTFPHPGHRCHALRSPGSIDTARQSTYCLSRGFTACDRYVVVRELADRERERMPPQPAKGSPAAPEKTSTADADSPTTVIHVFRADDSLARIAAAYGLTVEQIAAVNHLAPSGAVADGQRLVIPLRGTDAGASGQRSPHGTG
jgi:hypothetical protein